MLRDAEAMSQLILAGFDAQVASTWSAAACAVFHAEMAAEPMQTMIAQASYTLLAEEAGRIVGVLLMRAPNLLGMLFVLPEKQRQGVGRTLWGAVRHWVETSHSEVRTIELNASIGAVDFYRKIGFWPISAPYEVEGARAVRMACWLPALRLAAMPQEAGGPV